MSVNQAFLAEFDREMAITRKLLERVPTAQPDWAPHEKSRSMIALARHIAGIPNMGTIILTTAEFDAMAPRPAAGPPPATAAELTAAFDARVHELRPLLVDKTDAELQVPWSFKAGEKIALSMPKATALRSMFLNHLIHHRGQLSVYLRLNNIPVPAIYGPSADEPAS